MTDAEMKSGLYQSLCSQMKRISWKRLGTRLFPETDTIRLRISPVKLFVHGASSVLLVIALAYGFYRSWKAVLFLFPAGVIWYAHAVREERRRIVASGGSCFRDGMRSISAALSAGYSPENAVREAAKELEQLYGGHDVVVREFKLMVRKLNMNRPVEAVLLEAAQELELEDLKSFAEVFGVARRSGGRLAAIISDTVEVMEEKQATEAEVATVLSGKQFEQQILTAFPLALIAYLNISAGDFFNILYTSLFGRAVMSVCLAVYLAAVCVSWRICRIRV